MSRIVVAFSLYFGLAILAVILLRGDFRLAVLILLGGFALKTWIGFKKNLSTSVGENEGTMDAQRGESGPEA